MYSWGKLGFFYDIVEEWCRDTDGWICSDDRTDEEHEHKSMECRWAEEEHRKEDDDDRERCIDGSCESTGYSIVDHTRERDFFSWFVQIRADTIHDDDRIIDRVSEDCEYGSERKGIDLILWEKVRDDDIESDCDDNIMDERCSRYDCEWPARHTSDRTSECILNIEWYGEDSENEGNICWIFDIVSEWFSDIHMTGQCVSSSCYWERGRKSVFKLCFLCLDGCFLCMGFTESCFNDNRILSGDFIDHYVIDHVHSTECHAFLYLLGSSLYCIDWASSTSVFELHSSREVDSEIWLYKEDCEEWYDHESQCNPIESCAILEKREHEKTVRNISRNLYDEVWESQKKSKIMLADTKRIHYT